MNAPISNVIAEIPSPRPFSFNAIHIQREWIHRLLDEIKFDPVQNTVQHPPTHLYALRGDHNIIVLQGRYGRHRPIPWNNSMFQLHSLITAALPLYHFNVSTLNLFTEPQHKLRVGEWTEQIATDQPMLLLALGADTRTVELQRKPLIKWEMHHGAFCLAPPNTQFKVLPLAKQTHANPWLLIVFRSASQTA